MESWMDEHSWQLQERERKYKKVPHQTTELKNTKIELKNILEGFNNSLHEAEETINDMEDRTVKLTQTEQQKKK